MIPPIDPVKKNGGAAFNGNTSQGNRPQPHLYELNPNNPTRVKPLPTKVISLAEFCQGNFITRDQGYSAIKQRLLIAFRKYGEWWVRSNPECLDELLEYLNLDELLLDADSSGEP